MTVLRPASPIFDQNRKEYGSFLGHTKSLPAFRESFSSTLPTEGRCYSDAKTCNNIFDFKLAVKYGFDNRLKRKHDSYDILVKKGKYFSYNSSVKKGKHTKEKTKTYGKGSTRKKSDLHRLLEAVYSSVIGR